MEQDAMEKVFMESFTQYGDAIFRFCVIKVSNAEIAEDFTQEVFMRYWQALKGGKEMTNTRSYLYTIANNLAKDWYKKKKSQSLDEQIDGGYEPADIHAAGAQQRAAYVEALSAIDGMEQRDKEVLLLRHVEGLDPKDIAKVIGETANTVSVRINRATKRLQKRLHV